MSPIMSPSTHSTGSVSTPNSQGACFDPLDSLIDLSEYETFAFHSPQSSPAMKNGQFSKPVSNTPPTLPSTSQPALSGPSHQYDLYRQQTGIPQGAVANTLAINAKNTHINQYGFSDAYLSGFANEELIDFGTSPTPTFEDIDMDYGSPREPAFFYPEQPNRSEFIDPNAVNNPVPVVPTNSNHVGRLWPGMHQQQAAIAQAQAQQKQQQAIIQQQRQNSVAPQKPQKSKQASVDPVVEEKISQLLSSMRRSSGTSEADDSRMQSPNAMTPAQRMRKDEEDMDEDERLLVSEEGKKLSSKERRQLRNKVSARAFRSRRKEYISQLEGEIATKVNENHDLRTQNKALIEENTRLSDLTRMLLSSSAFSSFLDTLASNPTAVRQHGSTPAPTQEQPQQQQQAEHQHQVRKDVNTHQQMQHVGRTMIPEQNVDYAMLGVTANGRYHYQPQVYSVFSMPETAIDTELLSGKPSEFSAEIFESDDEKVELPIVECAPIAEIDIQPTMTTLECAEVADEEFDADPTFSLFTTPSTTTKSPTAPLSLPDLSLLTVKPQQYNLVIADNSDTDDDHSICRMLKLCDKLEATSTRLENLTLAL